MKYENKINIEDRLILARRTLYSLINTGLHASHMVLSIILLEDKHKILKHLSIFYDTIGFIPFDSCNPVLMNIDKSNTILCLSSRNMIDKTMCEVL
jgi:hypothetical protein